MSERPTPETERVKGALHTNWDDLLNHARQRAEARSTPSTTIGALVSPVTPWSGLAYATPTDSTKRPPTFKPPTPAKPHGGSASCEMAACVAPAGRCEFCWRR